MDFGKILSMPPAPDTFITISIILTILRIALPIPFSFRVIDASARFNLFLHSARYFGRAPRNLGVSVERYRRRSAKAFWREIFLVSGSDRSTRREAYAAISSVRTDISRFRRNACCVLAFFATALAYLLTILIFFKSSVARLRSSWVSRWGSHSLESQFAYAVSSRSSASPIPVGPMGRLHRPRPS